MVGCDEGVGLGGQTVLVVLVAASADNRGKMMNAQEGVGQNPLLMQVTILTASSLQTSLSRVHVMLSAAAENIIPLAIADCFGEGL